MAICKIGAKVVVPCFIALPFACLVLYGCTNHRIDEDRASADKLIEEARDLSSQSRLADALQKADAAIGKAPKYAAARITKADLLESAGRHEDSFSEVRQAFADSPDDPNVVLTMLRHMPPYAPSVEREALARKAVAQSPQSSMAHYFLANALILSRSTEKQSEALSELKVAAGISPRQPKIYMEMGRLQVLMGNYREASSSLETALAIGRANLRDQRTPPLAAFEEERNITARLAAIYKKLGSSRESSRMSARAAVLSAKLREIDAIRLLAQSSPQDLNAKQRIEAILQELMRSEQP